MGRLTALALVVGTVGLVLVAVVPRAEAEDPRARVAGEQLLHGNAPRSRLEAAQQLGRTMDAAAAAHLIRALIEDPDVAVRAACATGLANFHTEDARAALQRAQSDRSSIVRVAATRALATPTSHCSEIGIHLVDTHEHYYELCDDGLARRSRPWPVR